MIMYGYASAMGEGIELGLARMKVDRIVHVLGGLLYKRYIVSL